MQSSLSFIDSFTVRERALSLYIWRCSAMNEWCMSWNHNEIGSILHPGWNNEFVVLKFLLNMGKSTNWSYGFMTIYVFRVTTSLKRRRMVDGYREVSINHQPSIEQRNRVNGLLSLRYRSDVKIIPCYILQKKLNVNLQFFLFPCNNFAFTHFHIRV